jgi:hypothetical protein
MRVQARWPPIFPPAALPVLRSRCDQRTTLATLTVKIVAMARTLSPARRGSVILGDELDAGPSQSSASKEGQRELRRTSMGNEAIGPPLQTEAFFRLLRSFQIALALEPIETEL